MQCMPSMAEDTGLSDVAKRCLSVSAHGDTGMCLAAGVIGGLLSFVVINGINAAIDQALEALGYVPKLIHRAASVRAALA